MGRVRDVVPVLPVPLVATVMLAADEPMDAAQVAAAVTALAQQMQASGAHVHVPRGSLDYAAEIGLKILAMRRMVLEKDGKFSANKSEQDALEFYAASIAHFKEK